MASPYKQGARLTTNKCMSLFPMSVKEERCKVEYLHDAETLVDYIDSIYNSKGIYFCLLDVQITAPS